jgi:hypothetical protein
VRDAQLIECGHHELERHVIPTRPSLNEDLIRTEEDRFAPGDRSPGASMSICGQIFVFFQKLSTAHERVEGRMAINARGLREDERVEGRLLERVEGNSEN